MGDDDLATFAVRRATDLARHHGDSRVACFGASLQGEILARAGSLDALRALLDALPGVDHLAPADRVVAHARTAMLLVAIGETDSARDQLSAAEAAAGDAPLGSNAVECELARGLIALSAGDREIASSASSLIPWSKA